MRKRKIKKFLKKQLLEHELLLIRNKIECDFFEKQAKKICSEKEKKEFENKEAWLRAHQKEAHIRKTKKWKETVDRCRKLNEKIQMAGELEQRVIKLKRDRILIEGYIKYLKDLLKNE